MAAAAAHSGRFGLRLAARMVGPENPTSPVPAGQNVASWLQSPPVWVTSPSVAVEAGQIVVLRGWVRVPQPIAGSVDGLLVVDSLGGEPLAERVRLTAGWQDFLIYRVAPQSGPLTITFALTGLGEAWIDDVTIQPLVPGGQPGRPGQMLPPNFRQGVAGRR